MTVFISTLISLLCRVVVFLLVFGLKVINKPEGREELSEEDRHKEMMSFIGKYEKEIKTYGMFQDYDSR